MVENLPESHPTDAHKQASANYREAMDSEAERYREARAQLDKAHETTVLRLSHAYTDALAGLDKGGGS